MAALAAAGAASGMSFCAAAFQLGSAALRLPATEQSQLLPSLPPTTVLPRLLSRVAAIEAVLPLRQRVALPSGV